jgi:ABC-type glycerol-3-phosphate transport system permease component
MIGTKRVSRLRQILIYIVVALALVWMLFPVWWALVLSIKHPSTFSTGC